MLPMGRKTVGMLYNKVQAMTHLLEGKMSGSASKKSVPMANVEENEKTKKPLNSTEPSGCKPICNNVPSNEVMSTICGDLSRKESDSARVYDMRQATSAPLENYEGSSKFTVKIYSEGNDISKANILYQSKWAKHMDGAGQVSNSNSNASLPVTPGADSSARAGLAVMSPNEGREMRLRAGDEVNVLKLMNGPILKVDHSHQLPTRFENTDDIIDPFCEAGKPKQISFKDVTTAAYMIEGELVRTPCTRCTTADKYGFDLYLKKELLQYTGSFKERGARYALQCLPPDQKARGVVTASWGNHAQGVSITGFKLNIPVTVVMPKAAPLLKVRKCLGFKARVVLDGNNISEAKATAMKMAKDEGLLYINGYDHPHIIAGQGTIGLEILDQVPNPDYIVVPVGGGSMISGVSVAMKALSPNTKIIGVESEMCPSFTHAILKDGPIFTQCGSTLADGLAVPKVGYNAFATAVPNIDRMVVVDEKWIAVSVLRLVEEEKCIVEGAGAASFAALISGLLDDLKGKKVVAVLSGGNIDTTVLERVLERGLASEGRLIKFTVCITDRPGGINELCDILKSMGVAIKEIEHERAFLKNPYTVEINLTCEARDWNHSVELKEALEKTFEYVEFSKEPLIYEK